MNKPFRNRFEGPKLTPDQAARQGRASKLAFDALVQPAAVIAFLNTHHPELDGRPLDVAIESAEGLARVEHVLAACAAA